MVEPVEMGMKRMMLPMKRRLAQISQSRHHLRPDRRSGKRGIANDWPRIQAMQVPKSLHAR